MSLKKTIEETTERLNGALKYCNQTRAVLIGERTLDRTGEVFRRHFSERSVVLVADRNTFRAAGQAVEAALRQEPDLALEESLVIQDEDFHSDDTHLEQVRSFLARTGAMPIAVGSGTVNDLVKRASSELERAYMVVGTAASMDGYTAFGASIEMNGFKQTLTCPAPRVVLIDLDVLDHAPPEMTAAGYADLIAKVPAGADWMLADKVGTEPIDPVAWKIVQDHLRTWLADPEGIASHDKGSLCMLVEGLIMSGIAMQKASSSRTASGAEHMFSHLWDNQHHTYQGRAPSHGFKVGIGTLASCSLYERFVRLTEEDLLEAKRRAPNFFRPWSEISRDIEAVFGRTDLADQIMEQSRQKYVEVPEIRRRLDVYLEDWPDFRGRIAAQLLPTETVRDMLRKSGAPSRPEEIGIDRDRFLRSFGQAQLIRCRYNILDFMRETGQWEKCMDALK